MWHSRKINLNKRKVHCCSSAAAFLSPFLLSVPRGEYELKMQICAKIKSSEEESSAVPSSGHKCFNNVCMAHYVIWPPPTPAPPALFLRFQVGSSCCACSCSCRPAASSHRMAPCVLAPCSNLNKTQCDDSENNASPTTEMR